MSKYERIYRSIFEGKIYKSKQLTALLRRMAKSFALYCGNKEVSDSFLHNVLDFIEKSNIDCDLIDDYFLIVTGPHYVNHEFFIDLLKTVFMPYDPNSFGTYMEVFHNFLWLDLMNKNNKEWINKIKYQKIKDLYSNCLAFNNKLNDSFLFSYDYELPTLLYGYFYGYDLDLSIVNDVLSFYLDNRAYYIEKMTLNGIYFPYVEDDTIPKFFVKGFSDVFNEFIPVLIDDYKRMMVNKKKIK